MIETKEHYRQLLENIYNPDAPDAVDAVEELIEALREVAVKANKYRLLDFSTSDKFTVSIEGSTIEIDLIPELFDALIDLFVVLVALPDWIAEE